MSYILDALRKSDQQRHRGATPTLLSVPAATPPQRRSEPLIYGIAALVLIGAGTLIGWLRPWETKSAPVPARPAVAVSQPAPAPPDAAPAMAISAPPKTAEPPPALTPATPNPGAALVPPLVSTPQGNTPAPAVVTLGELPISIRQELPEMAVALHAYSQKPRDRLVSINNTLLREGDTAAPGVRLEEITPEGMVLSYKGFRFHRGVH